MNRSSTWKCCLPSFVPGVSWLNAGRGLFFFLLLLSFLSTLKKKTTVLWNCRTSYNYLTDDFCFSHPSSPPICSFSVGVTWVTGPHWFPLLRLSRESGWRFSEPSSCQARGARCLSSRTRFSGTILGAKDKERDGFVTATSPGQNWVCVALQGRRQWVNRSQWLY